MTLLKSNQKLAEEIREEVKGYEPGHCITVRVPLICEQIENIVLDPECDISFPKLIEVLAQMYGLYPQEFRIAYKRSMKRFRRIFDKANELKKKEEERNSKSEVIFKTGYQISL